MPCIHVYKDYPMRSRYAAILVAAVVPIACSDKPPQSQNGSKAPPVVSAHDTPSKPSPAQPGGPKPVVAGPGQGKEAAPALGVMPEGLDFSPLPDKPFDARIQYKPLPADIVQAFASAGGDPVVMPGPLEGFAIPQFSKVAQPAGRLPCFWFNAGSESALAALPVSPEAFGLILYEVPLTPALIAKLSNQPNLAALDVRSRFNAASIKELAKLKGLHSLTLWPKPQNRLGDLEAVATLKSLKCLEVHDSPLVRGPLLKQWATLPELIALNLNSVPKLVDGDLAAL